MNRRDRWALIAWAVLFALALVGAFVSSIGPGGVYMWAGPPPSTPERLELTLPQLDRERFTSCRPIERWDAERIPTSYVVVESDRRVHQLGVAAAWKLNTNTEPADDVWVIGACS